MNSVKYLLMGMIISMMSPFFLQAQIPDPVSFSVSSSPDTVLAGETFEIEIEASIEGDWHLYSILNAEDAGPFPTEFSAKSNNFVLTGEVTESDADVEYDPNFETELGWHSSFASFAVPIAIKTDREGRQNLDIEVYYQVCDDKVCLPPKTKSIIAAVEVAGVSENPVEAAITSASSNSEAVNDGNSGSTSRSGLGGDGIFGFIWLAILAGFAALLTPCVFPMVPLTVSYFSKQDGEGKSVGKAFMFGIAIVITFTLLGVLLAAIFGVSGAQNFASNPWVNLFIALVLILFAFSLLGMYELQLPHQLTNWLNRQSNQSSGIAGILFMALTISAVSFSCTAPFVGGVFAATTGGEWFYPIIGMIGFSAAFASPFVFFAAFPSWLESLPKSGAWMNIVKVLLGFIELAAAFKFLSNADLVWEWGLVSRPFTIAAWIAIFLLTGLYLIGSFSLKHETKPDHISTGRMLLAIPFFLFSFYLIPGLLGSSLGIWDAFLPPKQATDVSLVASIGTVGGTAAATSADEGWSDDYEASREVAAEAGKPVFIDFTGYTCTNCRAMESNVFPLAEVQSRFEQMELVKLYTDGGTDGPANQRFQFELTGNVALPTYAIVDPESGRLITQKLGYTKKDDFVAFLDEGLAQFDGE
ncbi:Thiol:disulfide interchange protein DsbD [Gracilimonas mengyeensis]|uniref:Thiol:disulfide interchange protein DsbD n=2 Tax=Gracilimonas mengyeensis TaxID=1302730 RepID=A0A521C4B1_9BACT|nr:Thiol:disulfide interchange protein DsbD [Gracilimonas mengyeensis]